jgi:Uma2 family endonuclease
MATPRTDTRLTYDDYVRIPDDGLRHEIIDGVHYVTPPPLLRHQVLLGRLHVAIANHLDSRPDSGEVYVSPVDTVFTQWDVVEPDLLFVAADQRHILTEANVQGAPALVVEILSPSTRRRDLGIKRDLFDRGGVREYWIVDPVQRDVVVHRRNADGLLEAIARLRADNVLQTPLMPGFALSMTKLFAD